MIYLIQPADYKTTIQDILNSRQLPFQALSAIPSPSQVFNTYFIINDIHYSNWSGLDVARAVREQDKTGHLILLADEIDYTRLFRSHLSFLVAIPFGEAEKEVRQYLDEFYENPV